MQYSNTTLKNGLIQRYERHSLLGDGVVSGDETLLKQVTADINETLFDLTNRILLSYDNFDWDDLTKTDFPVATTPLVAGQRDYQFDNIDFLKIKRLEVTWDGTNYYRAEPFDSATYPNGLGNDTNTDAHFAKSSPFYDPKSAGFWLYPLASADDVASGGKIRIEYTRAYDEYSYTDTLKEPPIDRPFHDLIAIGAALKSPTLPNDQYQKLQMRYQQGVAEMEAYYGTRDEDFIMSITPDLESYS